MARVIDLINPDENRLLRHPICGWVAWAATYPGSSRCLSWVIGPDKGKWLIVDDTVLFDERWSVSTFEEMEDYYRDAPSFANYKRPEWGQPKNAQS